MELTRRDALTSVGLTAVSAALIASPGAAREAAAQQMAGALPVRKPVGAFRGGYAGPPAPFPTEGRC